MTEVIPPYYASGRFVHRYTLVGNGFLYLPSDCVAVPSDLNANPLVTRYSVDPSVVMHIVERTNNSIVFEADAESVHTACYIGAVLSNDREEVYWLNESRPLP